VRRVKDAANLDGHEVKAHENGRRSILVVKIDFAVDLDKIFQRSRAAKPLNAAFEIAARHVAKVVPRKIIALSIRLGGETEAQVDQDHVFAVAWKRIERCTEPAAKPRDPPVREQRKSS
jgi:hypothetical protein